MSRPFSLRWPLALGFSLALAAAAWGAPPSVVSPGVVQPAFSPNNDHVQDDAFYFFTLAGDTAHVTVLVHADNAGFPGTVIDTLLSDSLLFVGPDTLSWAGKTTAGQVAPDGKYWITALAVNGDGTDSTAAAVGLILDTVAPSATLIQPAKVRELQIPNEIFVQSLVHEVIGKAWDNNALAHLVLTLSAKGHTLVDTLCAPCVLDTTAFDVFVPDSIANTDTLRIVIDPLDAAGNGRASPVAVVIDSIPPPAPVIDALASPIDRDSVLVMGTAIDADSVFITFDGAPGARERVQAGFRFEALFRRFAQGTHTFVAQSADMAGNLSPLSAPASFVYREILGIVFPERFQIGEYLQVNLGKPANAVLLRIYDLSGRLVKRLEDRSAKTIYEFAWDGSDQVGNPVGSGPYVVAVEADYTDGSRLAKRLAMVVTR